MLDYAIIASFVRSYQPVRGKFPPDRMAVSVFLGLELVEQTALVLIILDIRPEFSFALYVMTLVLNIGQAATVFVRYVGSEFSVRE